VIDLYAEDELPEVAYVDGNIALDQELHRVTSKRAALLPVLHDADAVGASVRYFCETARARLENCHDFESKRQFLADYVARVVYNRYKVTVRGSVPIMRKAGMSTSIPAVTGSALIAGLTPPLRKQQGT
jgi:hypothetical protein